MEIKNIIIILITIIIILAIGLVVEYFAITNSAEPITVINNATTNNTPANFLSNDSKSIDSEDPIEANRPKNDSGYKGNNPLHESETTNDGWNPTEHESYRESLSDGNEKIHYDDGYFRVVDSNGYVITYGYS